MAGKWLKRVLPLLVVAVIGCGSAEEQQPVVSVTGEVFYRSQPAEGALVVLHPRGEQAPDQWPLGYPRGTVSSDGAFQISTYGENDGAPEGEYQVLISWKKPTGDSETGDPEAETEDLLQERYSNPELSPLEASVAGPGTQIPRIDLK